MKIGTGAPSRISPQTTAPRVRNHFAPPVKSRTGTGIFAIAHYLSQTECWSPKRLFSTQLKQATELVCFAKQHVPFYRDRLGDTAADSDELTPETFAALPILARPPCKPPATR